MAERHTRYSVGDADAPRSWEPDDKCRDDVMNSVLTIILDAGGEISQKQIRLRLGDLMPGVPYGTLIAYTSASLLHFAQAGWIVMTGRDEERSQLWKVVD